VPKPAPLPTHSAFAGHRLLASGTLQEVATAVSRAQAGDPNAAILVFSNATGQQVEPDLADSRASAMVAKPRGRPRLGVVAREVTLLPEHWEWLGAQPGGASVALRKLVLHAMRANSTQDATRRARERTYAFMSALAGNLPGFEEATRALFAGDLEKLASTTSGWPADLRAHMLRLVEPDEAAPAMQAP
jgi:hypothetical protein